MKIKKQLFFLSFLLFTTFLFPNAHHTKEQINLYGVELCDAVCTALNTLKLEYPFVEFSQEIECPDCDCCIDVNLFDHCDKFSANMFSMG